MHDPLTHLANAGQSLSLRQPSFGTKVFFATLFLKFMLKRHFIGKKNSKLLEPHEPLSYGSEFESQMHRPSALQIMFGAHGPLSEHVSFSFLPPTVSQKN
jgi:hypothetical protein